MRLYCAESGGIPATRRESMSISTISARIPPFTPRLDIYAGDPSAGGTLLMAGNIPVNIPPGEAGGFWGGPITIHRIGDGTNLWYRRSI